MRYSHVFGEQDPTSEALRELRTQLVASRVATARVFASGGAVAPASTHPTRPSMPAAIARSVPNWPRLTAAYRRLYAAVVELLSVTPSDPTWLSLVASVREQLELVGRAEPECSPPWYQWDESSARVLAAYRDLEQGVDHMMKYSWRTPSWTSWERSVRQRLTACQQATQQVSR
jgi:hypothetical protein